MTEHTITVQCPHILEEDSEAGEAGTKCEADIDVECEIEPADSSYGADADGNRGMYVPAYLIPAYPPHSCEACKATYTSEELQDLEKQIQTECDNWHPSDPFDDYDGD